MKKYALRHKEFDTWKVLWGCSDMGMPDQDTLDKECMFHSLERISEEMEYYWENYDLIEITSHGQVKVSLNEVSTKSWYDTKEIKKFEDFRK